MLALRLLTAILLVAPTIAHADALQQQVLAHAKTMQPTDFAFTVTNRTERTGKPVNERVTRYDPRRTGSKWLPIKIDGAAPTAKQVEAAAKRGERGGEVPSYGRIANWFGAPATRVATTPTSVTYRFASLPKGAIKVGSNDISAKTTAEAVVNTASRVPFVERARFISSSPFRMFMVVKVDRFLVNANYRQLGDGRVVPDATTADFGGSFMGKAETMKTRTTFSDVVAVR